MAKISILVRRAIQARLTDSVIGYIACVDAAAEDYDCAVETVVPADWSPVHFLFGRVPPDAIEESSVLQYPLFTVDTMRTVTGSGASRWVMASTFAGTVDAVIDVHISWPDSAVLADFASYGDLVEDAMFACLNNPVKQLTGAGLAYSGRLSMQRGPIVMAGENWRQQLTFTAPFAALSGG